MALLCSYQALKMLSAVQAAFSPAEHIVCWISMQCVYRYFSQRTGCGKNSFFYSSDATTSGAATQSSPNVSNPSGSQVITGRHC